MWGYIFIAGFTLFICALIVGYSCYVVSSKISRYEGQEQDIKNWNKIKKIFKVKE